MNENFSEYSKKIAKHVQDAEDCVQTIKGTAELLQQQQKAASVNTQTTPPKTEK
ncbi:MAG: hypothetical protein IPG89_04365 [Bacteroidetes bacterium]|nr:hypothetical protein [Bacteroidota bacterium]